MTVSTIAFQNLIQDRMNAVETCMSHQAEGNHPDLAAAMAQLIKSGGKRVRPMVTLLVGEILGANPQALVKLAAAIEMLHTATLVHDDLIDGSLLRRGIPTLNANWDPAATVLTGDFVFAKAAKLAADAGSVVVMRLFAETLSTIVNGEIGQYFNSRGIASREDYYQRIYAKTASMFELAAGAAAVLSRAEQWVVDKFKQFGYQIGMAFQIMDDVLDFTGEQITVGKPVANDLRQGLITLPAIYYFEKFPADPDMQRVINRNGINEQGYQRLIVDIRQSGAIEEAVNEARSFVQTGLDLLADQPQSSHLDALTELAQYFVQRKI